MDPSVIVCAYATISTGLEYLDLSLQMQLSDLLMASQCTLNAAGSTSDASRGSVAGSQDATIPMRDRGMLSPGALTNLQGDLNDFAFIEMHLNASQCSAKTPALRSLQRRLNAYQGI